MRSLVWHRLWGQCRDTRRSASGERPCATTTATAHTDHADTPHEHDQSHTHAHTHTRRPRPHQLRRRGAKRRRSGFPGLAAFATAPRQNWPFLHPQQDAGMPSFGALSHNRKAPLRFFLFWSILITRFAFYHHVPAYTGCSGLAGEGCGATL